METITIFISGSSRGNPGPAAVGVCVVGADSKVLKEVAEKIGNATDDFAEYQAVLRGLQTAIDIYGEKTKKIKFEIKLDSELVKRQLNSEIQMNDPGLVPHFIEIHNMRISGFPNLIFTQISREFNKGADRLVSDALDS